jgi:hypothetical protein
MTAVDIVVHAKNSPLRIWWRRASWDFLFWHAASLMASIVTVAIAGFVTMVCGLCQINVDVGWTFCLPLLCVYYWFFASPITLAVSITKKFAPGIYMGAFPITVASLWLVVWLGGLGWFSNIAVCTTFIGGIAALVIAPSMCIRADEEAKKLRITKLGCHGAKHTEKAEEAESVVINTLSHDTAQAPALHLERQTD